MKKKLSLILAAALSLAMFTGCGTANGYTPMASTSDVAYNSIYATSDYSELYASEADEVYRTQASPEAESSAYASADTGAGSTPIASPSGYPQTNAKIVFTANIVFESTEFDTAIGSLSKLVTQMGGYFQHSDQNSYGYYRYGYYIVRVPSENFDEFCSSVGTGCVQLSFTSTGENVSDSYYDLEARLKTQQTKLDRLHALLEEANEMKDIIALEETISETELTIEYLTGSLRKYDSLAEYATVNITIEEVFENTTIEEPTKGFGAKMSDAFRSAVSSFVAGFQRLLIGFAYNWINWLIFFVILFAIFASVRKIYKKFIKRALPAPGAAQNKKSENSPEASDE